MHGGSRYSLYINIKISTIAVVLALLSLLLPAPANAIEGSSQTFHIVLASEIISSTLFIGVAQQMLKAIKQGGSLWKVWRLTAYGLTILAIGELQIPILEFLGWSGAGLRWATDGGIEILFMISTLLLLWGVRRFLQTVDARLTLASLPAIGLVAVGGISGAGAYYSLAHVTVNFFSFGPVFMQGCLLALACLAFWSAYKKLGGLIAKPFGALLLGLVFYTFITLQLPYFALSGYHNLFVTKGGLAFELIIAGVLLLRASLLLIKLVSDENTPAASKSRILKD